MPFRKLGQRITIAGALTLLPFIEAHAAKQCIDPALQAPVRTCVGNDGTPEVYVFQPNGGPSNQYAVGNAWGSVIFLDGTTPSQGYTTQYFAGAGVTSVTPVSNLLTGTGSLADPFIFTTLLDLGTTGVQIKQIFSYVLGERTLRKMWEITNNSATNVFNDLRFFHGGDAFFGGFDAARSWYDSTNTMVYLTNQTFTDSGLMGFYAHSTTPATHYYGGPQSGTGMAIFGGATPILPDSVHPNYVDAGYSLQWDRGSLTPGQTWTIVSYETWSLPGSVQVLTPTDDYVTPGTTMQKIFKVHNFDATNAANVTLSVNTAPNGWTASLPNGNTITVSALSVVNVPVNITVPAGATAGSSEKVTLTAVDSISGFTGTGAARYTILQADFSFNSASIQFTNTAVGATATKTLTLTNGAAAAPVNVGTIAALAAPYSITADSCSDTTLSAGASCSLTIAFAPTSAGTHTSTIPFPILAPMVTAQSIAITGTSGAVADYSFDTAALAFGSVVTGLTATKTVTLTNNAGGADVTVGTIASLSAPFSITADNCSNATLTAGNSCSVTVRFAPSSTGASSGNLQFPITAPSAATQDIALSGNGTIGGSLDPHYSFDVTSIVFANTPVGSTSTKTLTLTNSATAPDLTIGRVGTLSAPFSIASDSCTHVILKAGESCSVTLEFAPISEGASVATLDFPVLLPTARTHSIEINGNSNGNSNGNAVTTTNPVSADATTYTDPVLTSGNDSNTFGGGAFGGLALGALALAALRRRVALAGGHLDRDRVGTGAQQRNRYARHH